MLNCVETTSLLSQQLDQAISTSQRIQVGVHTMMCPACRRFGKHIQQLSQLAKSYTQFDQQTLPKEQDSD